MQHRNRLDVGSSKHKQRSIMMSEKQQKNRKQGGEIMADTRAPDICTAYPLVSDLCFN